MFRCKIKTTGYHEVRLSVDGQPLLVTDVGGQRTERRKWLNLLSPDVKAVVFMAALDEYNLTLEEDGTTNRLRESLGLFLTLLAVPALHKVAWIVFLNKRDLFRDKIARYPLSRYFDDVPARGLPLLSLLPLPP